MSITSLTYLNRDDTLNMAVVSGRGSRVGQPGHWDGGPPREAVSSAPPRIRRGGPHWTLGGDVMRRQRVWTGALAVLVVLAACGDADRADADAAASPAAEV